MLEVRDTNESKTMINHDIVIDPIKTANPVQSIHGSHGKNNVTPRPSSSNDYQAAPAALGSTKQMLTNIKKHMP